jgi:hypothetical protein
MKQFRAHFSEFLPSLLEAAGKEPELSVCEQDYEENSDVAHTRIVSESGVAKEKDIS